MLKAVKDKIGDIIPVTPGKINVKIRWIFSVQIDESFKIEIKLYGVYICDTQEVGYNAVGSAPSANIIIILASGIF